MANENKQLQLVKALDLPTFDDQIKNVFKEEAASFRASIIDLFNNDTSLQECDPMMVIGEAMKAASLRLPISKGLGFGYILAYKGKPQFQMGYRGFIQLALRSGQYESINADLVYEGELTRSDKLTGTFSINGKATSDVVEGYFAHIVLKNGFSKTLYMTKIQVEAHGKKYSPSYSSSYSPWKSNFDEMGIKTVLKKLLSHYGTLSVEMTQAFDTDISDEITANANSENMTFTQAEVIEKPKKEKKEKTEPATASTPSPETKKPAF